MTKYDTSTKAKDVVIYKVDIDKQPALAKRFKIRALPVLVYLKDSKQVAKTAGIKTAKKLKELEEKHF